MAGTGTSFSDVITDAVARAVRRAVDDVAWAAAPELTPNTAPEPPPPAVIDLTIPAPDEIDPYVIVGVKVGATWEVIVRAFRQRAKAWHADGDLARRLNAAYEELRIRRGKRPINGVLQPSAVPRKRDRDDGVDTADLDAPEHAWWAASPIDPFERDTRPRPGPVPEAEPEAPSSEVVPDDPYDVLRLAPSASWEDIVASYRKLARWYHPDGLVDPSPDDLASCEDMIRRLNAAYAELRVRRGR